jgi:hypothetical protein
MLGRARDCKAVATACTAAADAEISGAVDDDDDDEEEESV